MGKGRLEAFTDGVMAIIITIMVLEIKAPSGTDLTAFSSSLPILFTYALSFLIQLIPNYPGTAGANSSTTGPIVGGIFITIVFVLIWGIVGGLVSLLGAWLATRTHPYYTEAYEE